MIRKRPKRDGRWSHPAWLVAMAKDGLLELPDRLPWLLCKGLCSDSCGPAPMTPVEFQAVEVAIGRPLVVHADTLRCSALNDDNRCDAYQERPLICRLWGMSEGMICPHGCRTTTGEYLEYPEVVGLIARQEQLEGPMDTPPVVDR